MDYQVEAGVCYIKPDYLVENIKSNVTAEPHDDVNRYNKRKQYPEQEQGDCLDNELKVNQENKLQKCGKHARKRGQNKNRPVYKDDKSLHLCNTLMDGPINEKCALANCRYIHDLQEYMANKPKDIADHCPVFEAKGYCPRGVTCRFAKAHLDAFGRNIKQDNYDENDAQSTTCNGIKSNLQISLRKREYNFEKSKAVIKHAEEMRNLWKKDKPLGCCVVDNTTIEKRDSQLLHSIDFREKLMLSPLTTVGNLPFRRICKEFGADITCGEMACCVPIVKGLTQEWALTKRHKTEDIFGVQLCGNNPNIIAQAAQLLQETAKVDYLDLNIGCPIDLIYQQGGGSALMRRTNILELIVRACSNFNKQVPFTVKMRTGVYADKSVADDLMPLVEEWGAAAITLHGRSREQRYTKNSNWHYIEECAAKIKSIPVIGNGDIFSYEDYNEKRKIAPHVSSVMIGRGALIKPWIFQEIKQQKHLDPSSIERYEMLRKYVNYGLEHWGSDTKGVENTRRFLLEWQSFLYRYIPYELLLQPPQRINQRPQKFRGRDEMETLMSSSNSKDWIKLSEMLLGSVPEGFTFIPKHKANAY